MNGDGNSHSEWGNPGSGRLVVYVICHVWVLTLKFLIVVHIEVGKLVKVQGGEREHRWFEGNGEYEGLGGLEW